MASATSPAPIRPLFPYYGSKWNIARYYPPPRYGFVIEPFAGGGGYAAFYGTERAHLVDTDPIVIGTWWYLLNATPEEIMALPELPEVGDSVDNYALVDGAKWLIGFWLNRGSAQPKKSRTAYSARTDKAQLNWGPRAKERIATTLPRIAKWHASLGDYATVADVEATWFVDPPYGDKGRYYRNGIPDTTRLSAWCQTRRGQVIVCEGRGASWLPFEPLGSFKSSRGRADEVMWLNDRDLVQTTDDRLGYHRPRPKELG